MKHFTKILTFALAAIMVLGMLGMTSCASSNPAANNEKIKIGLTGPLTGGASIYGIAVKNSAQLAVDEINAAGGLNGILFELVMHDDKHDATNVPTLYSDLFEKGMRFFGYRYDQAGS